MELQGIEFKLNEIKSQLNVLMIVGALALLFLHFFWMAALAVLRGKIIELKNSLVEEPPVVVPEPMKTEMCVVAKKDIGELLYNFIPIDEGTVLFWTKKQSGAIYVKTPHATDTFPYVISENTEQRRYVYAKHIFDLIQRKNDEVSQAANK